MDAEEINREEIATLRKTSHAYGNELTKLNLKIDQVETALISLARLEATVSVWMTTTNEYRASLCTKIDKLFSITSDLPCKARAEATKGNNLEKKLLWAAIVGLYALMVAHLGWK